VPGAGLITAADEANPKVSRPGEVAAATLECDPGHTSESAFARITVADAKRVQVTYGLRVEIAQHRLAAMRQEVGRAAPAMGFPQKSAMRVRRKRRRSVFFRCSLRVL
jgi:hypothetical protein